MKIEPKVLRDLFAVHMNLARNPNVLSMLATAAVASSVWGDYTTRLLRFVDDELGKKRIMDAEAWSLLLMASTKQGVERETLSAACMNFTGQLVIESGLEADEFVNVISPPSESDTAIEQMMNAALLGFATSVLKEHRESANGAN